MPECEGLLGWLLSALPHPLCSRLCLLRPLAGRGEWGWSSQGGAAKGSGPAAACGMPRPSTGLGVVRGGQGWGRRSRRPASVYWGAGNYKAARIRSWGRRDSAKRTGWESNKEIKPRFQENKKKEDGRNRRTGEHVCEESRKPEVNFSGVWGAVRGGAGRKEEAEMKPRDTDDT